jgi:four helix bundle protein
MKDFKKLKVWEKAHRLTLDVYQTSATFPREELYGLTSQIRRSCLSIPSNIAEGCGRGSDTDFARFLQISMGSSSEVEYLLILSRDLQILRNDDYETLSDDVIQIKRMLTSLIKTLRS